MRSEHQLRSDREPHAMRILFSTSSFGFLRNFQSSIRRLAEQGHEIHLLAERSDTVDGQKMADALVAEHPEAHHCRLPALEPPPSLVHARHRAACLARLLALPRSRAGTTSPKLRARAASMAPALRAAACRTGRSSARGPVWRCSSRCVPRRGSTAAAAGRSGRGVRARAAGPAAAHARFCTSARIRWTTCATRGREASRASSASAAGTT